MTVSASPTGSVASTVISPKLLTSRTGSRSAACRAAPRAAAPVTVKMPRRGAARPGRAPARWCCARPAAGAPPRARRCRRRRNAAPAGTPSTRARVSDAARAGRGARRWRPACSTARRTAARRRSHCAAISVVHGLPRELVGQHLLGGHEAAADLSGQQAAAIEGVVRAEARDRLAVARRELAHEALDHDEQMGRRHAGLENRFAFAEIGDVDLGAHPIALLGREAVEGRMAEIEGARHGR